MARLLLLLVWLAYPAKLQAAADPILYEQFEGHTSGTVNGGVRFVNDVVGYGGVPDNHYAARFDGNPASSITFGPEAIVTGPDFTVEAFVKPIGNSDYAGIAVQGDEEDSQRSWALVLFPGNGLRFDVNPDGLHHPENQLLTPNRILHEDTWSHVAAVCQGSISRIYVNGYLAAETSRPAPGVYRSQRHPLRIGNAHRYAGLPRPFSGLIDEVRITPRALSPGEFIRTRQPMPQIKGPIPERYELPFNARNRAEADRWQQQARTRLLELVSERTKRYSLESRPLDFRIESSEERDGYTLHHASYQGNDGYRYSCLYAVPDGRGPFPAVLALHSHGGEGEDVFDPTSPSQAFGLRLVRGGYCCLAPSAPHRTFAAEQLWDVLRCVDILTRQKEVDAQRIGVMGLSTGGQWCMLAGACDPRVKVAVISGWLCTTEGMFEVFNCPCWELPGFVELMNVCEVNLLIAPRPVLFESADNDPTCLLKHANQGFTHVRDGYRLFGAENLLEHDVFRGSTRIHGTRAFPFIDKVLGGKSASAAMGMRP